MSYLELEPRKLRRRVNGGVGQPQNRTRVSVHGGRHRRDPVVLQADARPLPVPGRCRDVVGCRIVLGPLRPPDGRQQRGRLWPVVRATAATDADAGRQAVVVEAQRDQRAEGQHDGQQPLGHSTAVHVHGSCRTTTTMRFGRGGYTAISAWPGGAHGGRRR